MHLENLFADTVILGRKYFLFENACILSLTGELAGESLEVMHQHIPLVN